MLSTKSLSRKSRYSGKSTRCILEIHLFIVTWDIKSSNTVKALVVGKYSRNDFTGGLRFYNHQEMIQNVPNSCGILNKKIGILKEPPITNINKMETTDILTFVKNKYMNLYSRMLSSTRR